MLRCVRGCTPARLGPGLDATNWRGEQAIRPAVVARKVWGGNRTDRGAHTQEILISILQTCRQQQRPALPLLIELLCSPKPKRLELARLDRPPPRRPALRPELQSNRARQPPGRGPAKQIRLLLASCPEEA